jgi:hypothetical protein
MSSRTAAALVAVVLLETVRMKRQEIPPGTTLEFEEAQANDLIARGIARLPAKPETSKPSPEPVVEKVKSFTPEGATFAKLKKADQAADFVSDQKDPAILAELQALEYRRADGPRAEVVKALSEAFQALQPAGEK